MEGQQLLCLGPPCGLLGCGICSLLRCPCILSLTIPSCSLPLPPTSSVFLAAPDAEGGCSGRPYGPPPTSPPPPKLLWTPAHLSWVLAPGSSGLGYASSPGVALWLCHILPGNKAQSWFLSWPSTTRSSDRGFLDASSTHNGSGAQALIYVLPGNWSSPSLTHIYQGLIIYWVLMRLQWTESNCPCLHGPLRLSIMYYNWFVGVILHPYLDC